MIVAREPPLFQTVKKVFILSASIPLWNKIATIILVQFHRTSHFLCNLNIVCAYECACVRVCACVPHANKTIIFWNKNFTNLTSLSSCIQPVRVVLVDDLDRMRIPSWCPLWPAHSASQPVSQSPSQPLWLRCSPFVPWNRLYVLDVCSMYRQQYKASNFFRRSTIVKKTQENLLIKETLRSGLYVRSHSPPLPGAFQSPPLHMVVSLHCNAPVAEGPCGMPAYGVHGKSTRSVRVSNNYMSTLA